MLTSFHRAYFDLSIEKSAAGETDMKQGQRKKKKTLGWKERTNKRARGWEQSRPIFLWAGVWLSASCRGEAVEKEGATKKNGERGGGETSGGWTIPGKGTGGQQGGFFLVGRAERHFLKGLRAN